ncbi:MAG: tetratricopeptide repeat protein [Bacteroidota bacterium]
MYRYILPILATFLLFQCQSNDNKNTAASEIEQLEAAYEENPSGENLQSLLGAYTADSTGKYLEKQAYLQLSNNRFREGLPALKQLLKTEPSAKHALALAATYEQQKNQIAAQTAYQAYLLRYPKDGQVAAIQERLPKDIASVQKRLADVFEQTKNDSLRQAIPKIVSHYVASVEALALIAPETDSVAVHLKQAANFAQHFLRDIPRALSLYQWIVEEYKNTPEHEVALFTTAFVYDDEVEDIEIARKYYEDFIEQYPDSEFADDAEVLLGNLGKDDAEILEALLKKQQG